MEAFVPCCADGRRLARRGRPRAAPRRRSLVQCRAEAVDDAPPSAGIVEQALRFVTGGGDAPSLPSPADAAARRSELEDRQKRYRWTYEYVGGAAYIDGLPREERPHLRWLAGILPIVATTAVNLATDRPKQELRLKRLATEFTGVLNTTSEPHEDSSSTNAGVDSLAEVGKQLTGLVVDDDRVEGEGTSLQQYRDLFDVLAVPPIADSFEHDRVFAWYRVAGPNPMMIRGLRAVPDDMRLTDELFGALDAFRGDSLAAAAAESRLYIADYAALDGIEGGSDAETQLQKYVYAPKAVFAVPKRSQRGAAPQLLPVAIQCGQHGARSALLTPRSAPIAWLHAKTCVQAADASLHEIVFHLGRTHLLIEPFVAATRRQLAEQHPLFRLLESHLYGTHFINLAAVYALVQDGGPVDKLTAVPIDEGRSLAARAVSELDFNAWMPDRELASRGVMDDALPFPYRDDALRLWDIINEWVDAYLRRVYDGGSEAAMLADGELQAWANDLHTRGRIGGFGEAADGGGDGGAVRTFDYLVRSVSMVIFTASVQHAAVNYPQSTMMEFTPAMPLSGLAPPPPADGSQPYADMDAFVRAMYPTLQLADLQLSVLNIIGGYQYSSLGDYDAQRLHADVLGDAELRRALRRLRENLRALGTQIESRNDEEEEMGLPKYTYLNPENVPQSIHI